VRVPWWKARARRVVRRKFKTRNMGSSYCIHNKNPYSIRVSENCPIKLIRRPFYRPSHGRRDKSIFFDSVIVWKTLDFTGFFHHLTE
jgi:hypothetical protein